MYKYIFGRPACSGFIFLLNAFILSSCSSGSDDVPVDVTDENTVPMENTAPVATDFGVSVPPGDSVSGILSVSDAEDDSLAYSIVTAPVNGTVTIDNAGTGAYTYTLNNSADADSFTFWANDGLLDSNIATVTVTGTVAASPATGLQATAGDQRITLNWDAVPGADSYNVYWSSITGTATGGTVVTDVSPPFYHDGVTNGMNYYYVVTSVNAIGESEASSEVTATPVDILLSSLSFDDANLQACVDASGLTYVNEFSYILCQSAGIASLAGIENLTSLITIDFYNNNISDVSALSGLNNLSYIVLTYNSISDISSLSGLTNFIILHLNYNNISDVSALSGLNNLIALFLDSNNIIDVSPLSGLTSLTNLYLDSNNIIDVSPLSGLTSLTRLYLWNNNIGGQGVGNIDSLVTITGATDIILGRNPGISCNELATLITALGSPPVDTDFNQATSDVATDGVNCTNP